MPRTFKLSPKNYFSKQNPYLSNSKLQDWRKDKRYFFNKHIAHTYEMEMTDALLFGKACDEYIFKGFKKFQKLYRPVDRRDLKNPPKGYTEVGAKMYSEIVALCERVRNTTAFKELAEYQTQVILSYDMPIGKYFKGLCGALDWLKISHEYNVHSAHIVDLKTCRTLQENKYIYHCMEYGYISQMAMYGFLVSKTFGIPGNNIKFSHLVVEKDNEGIFKTKVFEFKPEMVWNEWYQIQGDLDMIKQETEFKTSDVSLINPIMIG